MSANRLKARRSRPPFVGSFKPGDTFRVECYDWKGGQIGNNDSASDVRDVNLLRVHYLSGPFRIEGAEPGNLLVVDLLDLGALPDSQWGFNGIFAKENGGGFLTEHFPAARKSCWDISGIYSTSRHVPGVRYPGMVHPGLIGCLPDHELLKQAARFDQETQTHKEQSMALYGYACESCGPFEEWAAIAVASEPCARPGCGAASGREVSAPNLALMNTSLRRALQRVDRTATDPRVVERKHLASCGCSMCSLRHDPKPSSRRWAIGR